MEFSFILTPYYISDVLAYRYINTFPENQSGGMNRLLSMTDWKGLRPQLKSQIFQSKSIQHEMAKRGETRPPKADLRSGIQLSQP